MLSIARQTTELPPELAAANVKIRATAKSYGLDFFDVIFEMLDYDQINHRLLRRLPRALPPLALRHGI